VIEHNGGAVSDYREKPVLSYDASMGIYLYERQALDVLASMTAPTVQFPELVLALLRGGERVAAFMTSADWYHVGTLAQHLEADRQLGKIWSEMDKEARD
jgi:NDP-sugar pyrophosphorylase family protein